MLDVVNGTEVTSDAEEVSVALDRLATRQKHRQYSTTNVLASASATQCSRTDVSEQGGEPENMFLRPRNGPKRVQSAHVRSRQSSAAAAERRKETEDVEDAADLRKRDPQHGSGQRLRQSLTADGTDVFGDCEDAEKSDAKRVRHWSRRSSAAAGNQSGDCAVSYYDDQRTMIEQSRALLEQSKAKHHALVAQAHSMQKQLRAGCRQFSEPSVQRSESQTTLAPKPPSVPSADKKPMSAFRSQRLARYYNLYPVASESG